jgi:hypothetical protein
MQNLERCEDAHLVGYATEAEILNLSTTSIHAENSASTFNPDMGKVGYARSQVSGRNWTISWNAPFSVNGNAVVTGTGYKYNLVGPLPDSYSSLYNQIVTGATQIQVPEWLYEGDYDFTIQPYDATHGVGFSNTFRFSDRA